MKSINEIAHQTNPVYFYNGDEREELMPIGNRILIGLNSMKSQDEKIKILNDLDVSASVFDINRSFPTDIETVPDKFIIAYLNNEWSSDAAIDVDARIERDPDIIFINKLYQSDPSDNVFLSTTLEFFIQTHNNEPLEKHQESLDKYGVESIQEFDKDSGLYLLKIENKNSLSALEVANALYETGNFMYAIPNFFRLVKLPAFTPDDPLYGNQWNLPMVNLPDAWDISKGSGVRIAILDAAVITTHLDLVTNIVTGYDPTGQPIGTDRHGTWVAGVAAGRGDNNLGIAGVAFQASIIPVRVGYTTNINQDAVIMDSWVIDGFNRCKNTAQLNADVINCSFTLGSTLSQIVATAINGAISNGRGGLGCLVAAATGNDAGSVKYPARLANVLAVGATNQSDQKAPFSNWGTGISIAAPGTGIVTTTVGNDYTTAPNTIQGTSFASPMVAGVAALMLANDPTLTSSVLNSELRSTADKVGGYTYNAQGHSQELGGGRVNAYAALL